MQVAKFVPSKQYVSYNEQFSVDLTVKMASNQSVPNTGWDVGFFISAFPVGVTDEMYMEYAHTPMEFPSGIAYGIIGYDISSSIGTGASKSVTIPNLCYIHFDHLIAYAGDGGAARRYPFQVRVEVTNYDTRTYYAFANYTGYFLTSRLDPVINNVTISDTREGNPLDHFGAFVYGQSLPRFVADVTLDPLDPSLTARHTLVLEQVDGGQTSLIYHEENNTGIFDPGPLFCEGTIHWVYSVVDSAGNSASTSGSFEVLPYSAPEITTFRVMRYKTLVGDGGEISYVDADDGENVRFTIAANVASVEELNAWELKVKYNRVGDPPITISPLSGTDGQAIAVIDDRTILTATIPASSDYEFTAELTDFFGSVTRLAMVYKAGGYLNVEKFGTAVGMRSTGTPENPLFETAYDARFYKGAKFYEAPEFDDPAAAREALGIGLLALGIQTGQINSTLPSEGKKTGNVVFPLPYTSAPRLLLSFTYPNSASINTVIKYWVAEKSETGFKWEMDSSGSATYAFTLEWLAIGTIAPNE